MTRPVDAIRALLFAKVVANRRVKTLRDALHEFAHVAELCGRLKDKSYLLLSNLVVTQALRVLKDEGEESSEIYNLKGLLLMQDDNQVDALKAFKKAVEVEPQHVDANLNIAFIAIRFRDFDTAAKSLNLAKKLCLSIQQM